MIILVNWILVTDTDRNLLISPSNTSVSRCSEMGPYYFNDAFLGGSDPGPSTGSSYRDFVIDGFIRLAPYANAVLLEALSPKEERFNLLSHLSAAIDPLAKCRKAFVDHLSSAA